MTQQASLLDLKVRVDSLRDREEDIAFPVPEATLGALAQAIGVDKIMSSVAELHLVPDGAAVDVTGLIRATVVQTCSVSLEPFEAVIDEPIDVRYAPQREIEAVIARHVDQEGEEGSSGMADAPEPIVDGVMDLGALLLEFLALGVDPYPRKPGVDFVEPAVDDETVKPFAALAQLRPKKAD